MISAPRHLMLDYALGSGLVLLSLLLPSLRGTGAGTVVLIAGAGVLGLAALTRWKGAILGLAFNLRTHAVADLVLGSGLAVLGLVMIGTGSPHAWAWILAVGLTLVVTSVLTQWDETEATSSPQVSSTSHTGPRQEGREEPGQSVSDENEAHDDSESPAEWPDPTRPDEARPGS